MRDRPRAAFRLHRCILNFDGLVFDTYVSAWRMALSCNFMHRGSQRQLIPMFNNVGSCSGMIRDSALTGAMNSPTPAANNPSVLNAVTARRNPIDAV
jgi:hypothetical protein